MKLDPNNSPETLALAKRARTIRKSKSRTKRQLYDHFNAQLRAIIEQDFEKIMQVFAIGGAVRVGLEVAVPNDKLVNADEQTPPEPAPEPPIERETATGNKLILLD